MENRSVIVLQRSAFNCHASSLGLRVETAGSGGNGFAKLRECEAIIWDMAAARDLIQRSKMKAIIPKTPRDCCKLLLFNLRDIQPTDEGIIRESLTHCDILTIRNDILPFVCKLLGMRSRSLMDNGFELMTAFGIGTLILNYGERGCLVFQGNAVSEKRGHLPFGHHSADEIDEAFLAAYYAASRDHKTLFTECHRMALNYLEHICAPDEKPVLP